MSWGSVREVSGRVALTEDDRMPVEEAIGPDISCACSAPACLLSILFDDDDDNGTGKWCLE